MRRMDNIVELKNLMGTTFRGIKTQGETSRPKSRGLEASEQNQIRERWAFGFFDARGKVAGPDDGEIRSPGFSNVSEILDFMKPSYIFGTRQRTTCIPSR